MGPARLEGEAQRLARAEQVGLAYDFIQRTWTKLIGQRGLGFAFLKKIIH